MPDAPLGYCAQHLLGILSAEESEEISRAGFGIPSKVTQNVPAAVTLVNGTALCFQHAVKALSGQ